ncbi:MAG: PTS sugar transporter subunit IIA [Brevinema sp.]
MSTFKNLLDTRIQKLDSCTSWENAVRLVAKPLLDGDFINSTYVDAMVNNIHNLGSYMIIIPGVAMPHSRPEDGCSKSGLSLLILDTPVLFPGDQKVWLVLGLAAAYSDAHIETIEAIADFFGDDQILETLKQAKNLEEIKAIITK